MIFVIFEDSEAQSTLKLLKYNFVIFRNNLILDNDKVVISSRNYIKTICHIVPIQKVVLIPSNLEHLQANLNKAPILVSACLIGENCRYDGKSKPQELIVPFSHYTIVKFCPESFKLPTPRPAATIIMTGSERRVVQIDTQVDVTSQFQQGAVEALRLCDEFGIIFAILKKRSPSCGVFFTNVDGQLQHGAGITAETLLSAGVICVDSLQ